MAGLTNPFEGVLSPDRKLNKRELARAIRLSIIAEEDAIALYESLADASSDSDTAKLLQDVANEEKVHVGEFQKIVEKLDSEELELVEEGKEEAEELISSAKIAGQQFGIKLLESTLASLEKDAEMGVGQIDQLLAILKTQFAPLVFLAVDVKAGLAYMAFKRILENMRKQKMKSQEDGEQTDLWGYPVVDFQNSQTTTSY